MSIEVTVNGNKCGESFLIAPDQNRSFPVPLGLRTDDGSTVNATLKVLPGGANIEIGKTEVIIGPEETFVNLHAVSASNRRNDTILQVLVDDVEQGTCSLTAISDLKVWFKGRFQARFATNPAFGTAAKPTMGSTIWLAGEEGFDRVIRFHDPVNLRSHAALIGVQIESVSGKLAAGSDEEFFQAGDPVIGQPANLGPDSYFVGNEPRNTGEGGLEHNGDGQEPIDKFEFHIGNWFSGRPRTSDDRPIPERNPVLSLIHISQCRNFCQSQ